MKLADLTRFGYAHSDRDSKKSLAVRLHIDVPLFVGLTALAVTSLIILYSSSGQSIDTVVRQALRILLAVGLMLALAQISPQHLQRWSPWHYASGLILLVLVRATKPPQKCNRLIKSSTTCTGYLKRRTSGSLSFWLGIRSRESTPVASSRNFPKKWRV